MILEKTDRKVGLVFELKVANSLDEMNNKVSESLDQIKDKSYYKDLELDNIENIYSYSIVFYKKKCVVS